MTMPQRHAPYYVRGLPFHLVAESKTPLEQVVAEALAIDDPRERVARLSAIGRGLLASGEPALAGPARELLLVAAQAGDPEAAVAAACMLLHGHGGPTQLDRSLELLRSAAGGGHTRAALVLGRILWSTRGSEAEGAHWLRAAADADEREAVHLLGLAYLRGQGVRKNLTRARKLQLAAAQAGLPDAQYELSLLLDRGSGGPIDAAGADAWEYKAASAGHARACLNRAVRCARGSPPDLGASGRWYTRAAEAGSAEAAARLGRMYLRGEGVTRNVKESRRWLERAVDLGFDWAVGES
jgi:TPR repeat protein